MRLRTKLFLTYLLPVAAVIAILAVSVRSIAIRAANAHMGGMMGGMMDGMMADIEQAMARGLTEALLAGTAAAVVIALVLSYLISGRLSATAGVLARAAHRVADGRYDERVDYATSDEVGEFVESFNRMAERLENTENLRRELLGTISHELRTPLGNIQGYMEGLMDGVVAAEPATYQLVHEEAARLTRLVADIERLSRVEAGVERLEVRNLEGERLAAEAVERMRPRFDSKGVDLQLAPAAGEAPVYADEDKVIQILVNLLENAHKYTPEGGRVSVETADANGVTTFVVADTGIGIPATDLPHVFERFYRVDKSRSSAGGGAGIGLAVARALAQRMGGDISVESSPGEGSRFTVSLPQPSHDRRRDRAGSA